MFRKFILAAIFAITQTASVSAQTANADTIKRYVKPVKYAEGPFGGKLYVARITYTIDGVEYSDTYYLDDQLSRVVAFKSN